MSEKNPEKDKNKDATPETDDELESLSADEKAAFEKIMAEINAANGAESPAEPASGQSAAAASDQTVAAANADSSDTSASEPTGSADMPSENPLDNADDDALSEEQQASIDQIMAEIASKRNGGTLTGVDEPGENESSDMSDDQQAALDKIMAEIESKRGGDKENDREPDEQDPEAGMSDDQQAALDKIMAEIESKNSREDAPLSDWVEPKTEDPDIGSEPEDDLEARVAEIKARVRPDRSPDAYQADGDNLTMEEFDDELSQLLTTAQADSPVKESDSAMAGGKKGGSPTANKRLGKKISDMQTAIKSDSASYGVPADPSDLEREALPAQQKEEYAILQEVPFSDDDPVSRTEKPHSRSAGSRTKGFWTAKTWIGLAVALNLTLLAGVGYWAYHYRIDSPQVETAAFAPPPTPLAAPVSTPAQTPSTTAQAAPSAANSSGWAPSGSATGGPTDWTGPGSAQMAEPSFAGLQIELASARTDIQVKISDIQQLKSFYSRGIAEEIEKIENILINGKIPSFDQAMADTRIELALRAIQRRGTYIVKLDTPLAQLTAKSEEMLFLERRARTFEILNRGIHGLPLAGFSREVNTAIGSYLEFNTQLSIDRVEVAASPMAEVWRMVSKQLNEKANLLAQRTPLNRAISAEICKGNYSRNYMLTALSPETGNCLIQWSGKDLYLNELTELTPEVARILAQWPGEWLSLNGLWELSGEAAGELARWPGKRLSLNGLVALSPEATAQLSQWQGAQLEMVGLLSIGRWQNYGTRLFLSEKLRLQLEAQ